MNRLSDCFFKVLEDEIKYMWDNMSCKDVYKLYFDFWEALKKKTGSADGFTGLSEVIVFTILKELIEREYGKLECNEYTKDTYYWNNSKFAIERGLTVNINGKQREPDIVIWKNPSKDLRKKLPDYAIEIKIYTAEKGEKTVEDAINRLKTIRAAKNTFRGLLIFYNHPSKFDEVKKLLEREKDWLDWLILKDNSKNFVEILKAWLEQNE